MVDSLWERPTHMHPARAPQRPQKHDPEHNHNHKNAHRPSAYPRSLSLVLLFRKLRGVPTPPSPPFRGVDGGTPTIFRSPAPKPPPSCTRCTARTARRAASPICAGGRALSTRDKARKSSSGSPPAIDRACDVDAAVPVPAAGSVADRRSDDDEATFTKPTKEADPSAGCG